MTTLVANSQLNLEAFIAGADLLSLFEWAEVLIQTGTTFQIKDVDDTQEVLTLTGSFGGYNEGGYPTTGTITGGSYEPGNTGNPSFSFSNASMTVQAFTAYVNVNDMAGLFGALLGGNDHLIGSSLSDVLSGFAGADILDGGAGADILKGGTGNDSYIIDNVSDHATEFAGEGTDLVTSSVTFGLASNLENLTLTGAAAINGSGNNLNNTIIGNAAANVLNGGTGADTMLGGAGNDSFYVDNVGDQASEIADQGTDIVYSGVSFTLWANVENLTLTGTATNGGGNAGNNIIIGNAQNNVLNGDVGADTMLGGAGNDIFYVDNAGDQVSEIVNEGTDHVYSSMSFSLWSNVENLTLTGTATNGGGNAGNNVIIGNAQNNVLNGDIGADTMLGGAGNDIFYVDNAGDEASEIANEGTDHVYSSMSFSLWSNVENLTLTGTATNGGGNDLDNTIIGNAQNNILNGHAGADTMLGGAGNDTFYVDNAGDIASEIAGEGTDQVYSSVSFTLWSDVENLTLTGAEATNATGNAQGNTITGNGASNVLAGGGGNDILQGGAGADTMIGGTGDDIFYVDDEGDMVTENANEGTDTVYSSVHFGGSWLEFENLTLTGNAAINGHGNGQDNVITGNITSNLITGGAGLDIIDGGGGNDSLYGDAGRDELAGGAGQDTLIGGAGGDWLSGGTDADLFDFDDWTHSEYLNPEGWDRITDFQTGVDVIDLSSIDANIVGGTDNDAFQYMGYDVLVYTENGPEFATRIAGQLAIMGPEFNSAANSYSIVADIDGDGTIDLRIDISSPVVVQSSDILL